MTSATISPKKSQRAENFIKRAKEEGYSDEDIINEVKRRYAGNQGGVTGQWKPGATGTWAEPPLTTSDRFKQGMVNDPLTGLTQLATESELAGLVAPQWTKNKQSQIKEQEAAYQARRGETGIDWARLSGNILNPVNLGIMAATKIPPTATMPQAITQGVLQGGMMSGLAPVFGDQSRAEQTTAGMAGGGIAAPLSRLLSRVVSPKVDPDVALLRKEGVTPTIGQSLGGVPKRIEDKATSFPIMGDQIQNARSVGYDKFNKAGYNRALKPIGEKSKESAGFEGMKEVHTKLNNAYEAIKQKIQFKPDNQFIANTTQLRQSLSALPDSDQKLFDNIIDRISKRATPQGNMSGETFKNVESTLTDEISRLAKDQRYEKLVLADALKQYQQEMRDTLTRVNPALAKELQAINTGWANYAILRDAASGAAASKNGEFTPSQLMAAVRAGAKRQGQAVGKGKISEGRALMQELASAGVNVLPSQYPDSGTAGRLLQDLLLNPVIGVPKVITGMTVGAAGAVPYAPGVRQGLDLLMNARPAGADLMAETIRRYPGLLSPVAPAFINSGSNGK
jgi:hypothetical protein